MWRDWKGYQSTAFSTSRTWIVYLYTKWGKARVGIVSQQKLWWFVACSFLFHLTSCGKHKIHDRREPVLFGEDLRCTDMLCLCSKTYCRYDSLSKKFICSCKGLNKRRFQDSGDGPMAKYWKSLGETENVTSSNRGFRTKIHCVATYEQTKKSPSYFRSKMVSWIRLNPNSSIESIYSMNTRYSRIFVSFN